MSLQDFLNANPIDGLTDEVVISDRFKDANGALLKFKIRVANSEELGNYRKKSMKVDAKKKTVEVDSAQLTQDIVINHTIYPNFKDAQSLQKLGCTTPSQYLTKVLLPGEIEQLALSIQRLSGYDKEMDELVDEAKN